MTYARARLLLSMSGVGCIVVASALLIWTQYPLRVFPDSES
ncbi:MAG: hypothetical protein AAGJ40_19560 [Planctomycetota bacterium]